MKKIFIILGLVALGLTAFFLVKNKNKTADTPETVQKKRISEPVNIIPVSERPYLSISPLSDGHNVQITVHALNKPAQSAEYELEYQAGSLLQGAFGSLQMDNLPESTKVLMGSCSAGGACTFHEDVQGGSLLARFDEPEAYVIKSNWKYIDNAKRNDQVSSKDAKFQLTAPGLAKQRLIIVYNSPGIPEAPKGEVVSDIYSLATSGNLTGEGELTMRATAEGENLQIAGWDGEEWTYYEGKVEGKMITAEVDLVELYLVVSK
jgi:hypothetical protein